MIVTLPYFMYCCYYLVSVRKCILPSGVVVYSLLDFEISTPRPPLLLSLCSNLGPDTTILVFTGG